VSHLCTLKYGGGEGEEVDMVIVDGEHAKTPVGHVTDVPACMGVSHSVCTRKVKIYPHL
jgi:hypothetical protein